MVHGRFLISPAFPAGETTGAVFEPYCDTMYAIDGRHGGNSHRCIGMGSGKTDSPWNLSFAVYQGVGSVWDAQIILCTRGQLSICLSVSLLSSVLVDAYVFSFTRTHGTERR